MLDMLRRLAPIAATGAVALTACSGQRSRGPVCGIALLTGPMLVQQRLDDPNAVLTDVPRGLPESLPIRLGLKADTGRVSVASQTQGQLLVTYAGRNFPDSATYALLVVDDSTQRLIGVMVYESPPPRREYPRLGAVMSGDKAVELLGVRVNWPDVSNPTCPLLGSPAPASAARS